MNQKVSIIIPCYNDHLYVEQAVNSALKQTYSKKEIIVVDDGSNAQTKAVLKKLEPKIDLLITQENMGVSAARNNGIKAASGKYILVLDSDDYFEPEFCEKAIELFENDKNIKIVTCYARWFVDDKNFQIFKPSGGKLKNYLIKNCAMGSIFLKSDWEKIGGYDENLKGYEDWEFYIRLHQNGGITKVIPEILFHYRNKNNSNNKKANKNKYKLLKYIYLKQANLYKDNFELFTNHLLSLVEQEEKEKIKNIQRLDFVVGKTILSPLRFLKSKLTK